MRQVALVVKKEWLNFLGGDRGLFVVYGVIILSWGMLIATWKDTGASLSLPLWIAGFSVIVSATFGSTVFVSERVSGALEIILTSGIPRGAILGGKMLFVFCMTVVIALGCLGVGLLLTSLMPEGQKGLFAVLDPPLSAIFASATFLTAACGAYFSVLLPNPRVSHLLNLFVVSLIMALNIAIPRITLPITAAIMTACGVAFTLLARRQFESEKIVKPVIL
jgi:ABC-type Na+ efflux pump permease subunit